MIAPISSPLTVLTPLPWPHHGGSIPYSMTLGLVHDLLVNGRWVEMSVPELSLRIKKP